MVRPVAALSDADAGAARGPWVPSGYMGDTRALKVDERCADRPFAGETCLRVEYTDHIGWAGIFWQDPANDWGEKLGGPIWRRRRRSCFVRAADSVRSWFGSWLIRSTADAVCCEFGVWLLPRRDQRQESVNTEKKHQKCVLKMLLRISA